MPIPNEYHIPREEKKEYPPLPRNIYQAELLEIDLKDAKGKFAKPGDKNFVFQFTLLDGKDANGNLRGRNVWANFVPTSLYIGKNGKNALWQIVEAFHGRELSQKEEAEGLNGAQLNEFVGRQIKIFIDHRLKDGKTYNNITSYIPAETFMTPLTNEEKEEARVKIKKEEPTPETDNNNDEPPMIAEPEIPDFGDGLTDEQRAEIN